MILRWCEEEGVTVRVEGGRGREGRGGVREGGSEEGRGSEGVREQEGVRV